MYVDTVFHARQKPRKMRRRRHRVGVRIHRVGVRAISPACAADNRLRAERQGKHVAVGHAALLVAAGVASGLAGSVAGLASLFSYPALLGSWVGPMVVRRVPETPLRIAIAVAGLGLAASLWYRATV